LLEGSYELNHFKLHEHGPGLGFYFYPNEQVSPFWWGPLKLQRVHQTYRRLYPDGALLRREGILFAMMWLCLAVSAGLFQFGFLGVAWLATCGGLLVWFMYFRRPRVKTVDNELGKIGRERASLNAKRR
jgi:hypothetical protein